MFLLEALKNSILIICILFMIKYYDMFKMHWLNVLEL